MKRTKYCGEFKRADIGTKASAAGWVQTKRDMGGVIFLDLRDREGVLQVVVNLSYISEKEFRLAEGLKNESVIEVYGEIFLRDEETYNPNIKTGEIELRATKLVVLSSAAPLPFPLDSAADIREDLRLKYRFLDLRRNEMFENLRFRHRLTSQIRKYLDGDGFLEVETPMLAKSTPEGAREYLVPSRVHKGSYYALPQSPQIFKQLLMVGGIDKYYQVARCFRDEDLRADRQPEFTQVDMELSFVTQEDILIHLEKLFKYIMKSTMGIDMAEPFLRITWAEAMDIYGSDKPDLRFQLPIVDMTDIAKSCSFSVFRNVCDKGGVVRAINVKGGAAFSRSEIEALTDKAISCGAKGMAWIALRENGEIYSILTKYFAEEELRAMLARADVQKGDFLLFCADKLATVRRTLGTLRTTIANMQGLIKPSDYKFLFVTDFPQFEWSEEENRFLATHHPFTMPYEEDLEYLFSDPARVRAQAYDAVLNGVELGSGSVRIHNREVQQKMFGALGFTPAEANEKFGFMINAFNYGTPPHAGFAFGLDRLAMQLLEAASLRDVVAFPKTKDAACLMTGAPDFVDSAQLEKLGLTPDMGEGKATARAKSAASAEIDVDKVANLSKLYIPAEKKERLREDMSAIIDFANTLSAIDTDGVPITAHILPLQNVWREDEATPSLGRDALLENAPNTADGYICVPKAIE